MMTVTEWLETYASETWMPTWMDVRKRGFGKPLEEQFGILRAIEDYRLTYPEIYLRRGEISQTFDMTFASRMINRETLPMWQIAVEKTLIRVGPKFEQMIKLYNEMGDLSVKGTFGDTTTEYDGLTERTSILDTPDTPSDWEDGYADHRTERVTEGSFTVSQTLPGGEVQSVNAAVDAFRNVIQDFVDEFNTCFLNIFKS